MGNDEEEQNSQSIQDMAEKKALEEGWKLHYDTCKHLTTLSTGSILIMVAFIEKLFTNPTLKGLVALSFGLFVLSIITSSMAMIGIGAAIRQRFSIDTFDRVYNYGTVMLSFTCFFIGIVILIVFAMVNLDR
ncbi:MAG TPA: hypothetical protein VF666_03130 [Pyrinomonadaceae bacterium]